MVQSIGCERYDESMGYVCGRKVYNLVTHRRGIPRNERVIIPKLYRRGSSQERRSANRYIQSDPNGKAIRQMRR